MGRLTTDFAKAFSRDLKKERQTTQLEPDRA